jgi:undecaprenyl-diphosphatase
MMTLQPLLKKYTYLFFVWAGLISYAQIYVGVHYPLDVLVGTLIGITLGYTFAKLYLKWNDKLTISSH